MNKSGLTNNQEGLLHTLSSSDLALEEQESKASRKGFSVWIRALLQDWRQGTVGVKGRSDVARSNKKPWKQKGTGRARAGTARSPLWRGGGVTFGPQERVKSLRVNKKMKKNILGSLLLDRLNAGAVHALNWELNNEKPKTSLAYNALKKAGFSDKPVTIFLSVNDMMTFASFANIPFVRILFFDQANAFDLAYANNWIVLQKDVDLFKKMVAQWL